MTGLLVQPFVGALSDRTDSRWGRRTPYFLIGAIFCSIALFFMPFSPTLWFAAGLLWILDAANNVTMAPYRAYVSARLPLEKPDACPEDTLNRILWRAMRGTAAYPEWAVKPAEDDD